MGRSVGVPARCAGVALLPGARQRLFGRPARPNQVRAGAFAALLSSGVEPRRACRRRRRRGPRHHAKADSAADTGTAEAEARAQWVARWPRRREQVAVAESAADASFT